MKHIVYAHLILITNLVCTAPTHAKVWQQLSALIGNMPYQDVINREYPSAPETTVTVVNQNGNITIKSWHHSHVCLKAVKKSTKSEFLPELLVKEKIATANDHTTLTITSAKKTETANGSIDFTLMVPAQTHLNISTHKGNICIEDPRGPVVTRTENGSISIHNAAHTVNANTQISGPITINGAHHNVHATTDNGNITIRNARRSIIAQAKSKGSITIASNYIAPNSHLKLLTQSGNIILSLPEKTHATIDGNATHGTFVCEYPITLSPQTTPLNKDAWTRFRRQAQGIIGTDRQDQATITVASTNGNIKIMKPKEYHSPLAMLKKFCSWGTV